MSGRRDSAGRPTTTFSNPEGTRRVDSTTATGLQVRCAQENWTRRYSEGRRRVLGRRWSINRDAELAAEDVIEMCGGTWRAERWAEDLVAAIRRTRR